MCTFNSAVIVLHIYFSSTHSTPKVLLIHYARVHNFSSRLRRGRFLDFLDDIHALDDFAKDHMLSVEPAGNDRSDEELGAVRVGSCVCHGQEARLGVLNYEVLVIKFRTVDGLSARTIASSKIAPLDHEIRDHTVKFGSLVSHELSVVVMSTDCQFTEIVAGLLDIGVVQPENNTPSSFTTN